MEKVDRLCSVRVLLLAGPEFTDVELEFLALEDVTVGAAALAWAGGDGGVDTTGGDLGFECRVDFGVCRKNR
jgi:hypothetical protein